MSQYEVNSANKENDATNDDHANATSAPPHLKRTSSGLEVLPVLRRRALLQRREVLLDERARRDVEQERHCDVGGMHRFGVRFYFDEPISGLDTCNDITTHFCHH